MGENDSETRKLEAVPVEPPTIWTWPASAMSPPTISRVEVSIGTGFTSLFRLVGVQGPLEKS